MELNIYSRKMRNIAKKTILSYFQSPLTPYFVQYTTSDRQYFVEEAMIFRFLLPQITVLFIFVIPRAMLIVNITNAENQIHSSSDIE